MKNKILSITRGSIPYIKELRQIAGSVTASILMQQLDYWFARYPDGFFKFLEPCSHSAYKDGDSWTEELGFSKDEFRAAFLKLGVHYKSKSKFTAVRDPFQGKLYCSYHDRPNGTVHYRRNHALVDRLLDQIQKGLTSEVARKSAIPISRDGQGRFTESGNPDFLLYTETTNKDYLPEITKYEEGVSEKTPSATSFSEVFAMELENDLDGEDFETMANPKAKTSRTAAKKINEPLTSLVKTQEELYGAPNFFSTERIGDRLYRFTADGQVRLPSATSLEKTARRLTLKYLQVWLYQQLECFDFEIGRAEDGFVWGYDPKDKEWLSETDLKPVRLLLNLATNYHHALTVAQFNDEAIDWFEKILWCLRRSKLTAQQLEDLSIAQLLGLRLKEVDLNLE